MVVLVVNMIKDHRHNQAGNEGCLDGKIHDYDSPSHVMKEFQEEKHEKSDAQGFQDRQAGRNPEEHIEQKTK